jgi:hypothetical protein
MRRALLPLALLALAGGCASPGPGGRDFRERPLAANPSAVIAAELAFARLAQDKGQWTAFRETAAPDAVMFVPQRVKAADWLKGRADPPASVTWQPHAVVMSCDGSAAATTGAWQGANGAHGWFTTIWRRDKDGGFHWVLDHGAAIDGPPRAAPEFISAKLASCGPMLPPASFMTEPGADRAGGYSDDQSLTWDSVVQPDGARRVTVWRREGDTRVVALENSVTAAEAAR